MSSESIADPSILMVELSRPDNWTALVDLVEATRSPHQNTAPWRRCLWVARTAGANVAFFQTEYDCRDYASEYKNFYSKLHHPPSQYAQRLHFFKTDSPEALKGQDARTSLGTTVEAVNSNQATYLGYIVVRPGDLEIVGRTMLTPPPRVVCRTLVEEHVDLIGHELAIRAVPFMQQDARFAVCAHVAVWICRHSAHLREGLSRISIGDVIKEAHKSGETGIHGLASDEAVRLLERLDTHVYWYDENDIPETMPETFPTQQERDELLSEQDDFESGRHVESAHRAEAESPLDPILRKNPKKLMRSVSKRQQYANAEGRLRRAMSHVVQRTNNSGLPCYVSTGLHAFVVCGYEFDSDRNAYTFTVQDDQNGPYIQVRDIMRDYEWDRQRQVPGPDLSMPPLPAKRDAWPVPPSPITYARQKAIATALGRDTVLTGTGVPPRYAWREIILAYPSGCLVSPESAERASVTVLSREIATLQQFFVESGEASWPTFDDLIAAAESSLLGFRTYVTSSERFKETLDARGYSNDTIALLRQQNFSPQVIVVELLDRRLHSKQRRCYGEVTFDATSNPGAPRVTSVRFDELIGVPGATGDLEYSLVESRAVLTGSPGSVNNL